MVFFLKTFFRNCDEVSVDQFVHNTKAIRQKNTSVTGQVFGFESLSAPSELPLCLEIYSVFSGVANLKLSTFGKSWRNSANWVC